MADNRKRTPWFSGEKFPKRTGWYERRYSDTDMIHMARWNGNAWVFSDDRHASLYQNEEWRGLANKPKGAK